MSAFKITCPHCEAVMKTPRPVPAGKRLTCPKCGDEFTTPDAGVGAAAAEAPKKKAADPRTATKAAGKPAAKSPAKAAKGAPAPPPKPADDDDEGGTYSFADEKKKPAGGGDDDDEDEEDEATKQRKKDLEFALDTSIKDPRGPAQARVIWPSNLLIICGAVPFFLYFGFILFLVWPFFFAERVVPPDVVFEWKTAKEPVWTKYSELSDAEKKKVDSVQWQWVVPADAKAYEAYWPWDFWGIPLRITLVCCCVFWMCLAGTIAYGGVKMQMLESWTWGMVSSCICLGLGVIGGWAFGLAVGLWCVLVLNDPKVKAGFEYKAE